MKCLKCLKRKQLKAFSKDQRWCKRYQKKYYQKYRQTHATELKNYRSKYYKRNVDKFKADRKKWVQANADKLKEYMRRYSKEYNKKNPEVVKKSIKKYAKSPKGKFTEYRRSATKRHIKFELTLDQFKIFWKRDCFYCKKSIQTIGLDRINHKKGYTLTNVVPCDKDCNRAKADMTYANFLELCKRVTEHGQEKTRRRE